MTNNIMPAVGRQTHSHSSRSPHVDFQAINRAALHQAETVCRWLLPRGQKVGREYLALNPKRHDRSIGSLKVNLATGLWADFATEDRGGDLIALTAWILDVRQSEAARLLASFLQISTEAQS